MANHLTGAQRHNNRLDKIMKEARLNGTLRANRQPVMELLLVSEIMTIVDNRDGITQSDYQSTLQAIIMHAYDAGYDACIKYINE